MGFLDHSTNNIIIDAVLTDTGRRLLARNDGSFSIDKFALADDEIDYSIIKKYGRLIGKEKIVKNTPVMEAQTYMNLAQKHKCVSLPTPNLVKLPSLGMTLQSGASSLAMTVAEDTTTNVSEVILRQEITGQAQITNAQRDSMFQVKMDNRFLTIQGKSAENVTDNIAHYLLTADGDTTSQGGSKLTFSVATRPINNFSIFSTYASNKIIKTYVTATGFFTGIERIIEVQITNTLAS
jgi:hypothetical protein